MQPFAAFLENALGDFLIAEFDPETGEVNVVTHSPSASASDLKADAGGELGVTAARAPVEGIAMGGASLRRARPLSSPGASRGGDR